jgi:hypothetical protein
MAWEALPSAIIGAILALSGTLLADVRRDRRSRERDREADRRGTCVAFISALTEGLGALRRVPAERDPARRRLATAEAMAPLYVAREQLLVSGTAALVVSGEEAFHRLIDVRDAVRRGAELDSVEYHDAYHAFSEAVWRFRLAVRQDLGEAPLTSADLNRPDFSDRDRCAVCAARRDTDQ